MDLDLQFRNAESPMVQSLTIVNPDVAEADVALSDVLTRYIWDMALRSLTSLMRRGR